MATTILPPGPRAPEPPRREELESEVGDTWRDVEMHAPVATAVPWPDELADTWPAPQMGEATST